MPEDPDLYLSDQARAATYPSGSIDYQSQRHRELQLACRGRGRTNIVCSALFPSQLQVTRVDEPSQDKSSLRRAQETEFGCFPASDRSPLIHVGQNHPILLNGIGVLEANVGTRLRGPVERCSQVEPAATPVTSRLHKPQLRQACELSS